MNSEFENSETESLSVDDVKIRGFLSGLGRVSAPPNFNARVRARIAEGRPRGFGFSPALRYALPLVLVLLVAGYFVIDRNYWVNQSMPPTAAAVNESKMPPEPNAPAVKSSSNSVAIAESKNTQNFEPVPSVIGPARKTVRPNESLARSNKNMNGGSFDTTVKQPSVILPKGIGTSGNILSNTNAQNNGAKLPVSEVLSFIGISADFDSEGWIVKLIEQNSAAKRSDIKIGDVIIGIGDQSVIKTTEFSGRVDAKSIKIKRGLNIMEIKLNY